MVDSGKLGVIKFALNTEPKNNKYGELAITLTTIRSSVQYRRPTLAAWTTSSCLPELPAATAFAVARVTPFVALIKSSGVAILSGSPSCKF